MSILAVYRKPISFHLPAGWQPTSKVDSTCRTDYCIADCLLGQASTMSSQLSSDFNSDPRFLSCPRSRHDARQKQEIQADERGERATLRWDVTITGAVPSTRYHLVLPPPSPCTGIRDATLRYAPWYREQSTHCLGTQVLLIADQNQISHSGADEVQSDKASCQPRLGEAPVLSSSSTVSGISGLVWG